jgi:predicted nucleotidyltransferase
VVGGYAFAFHAKPRYTKDLDIFIDSTPDNAQRILQALDDFGFGSLGLTLEDLTTPGNIIQLGHPPSRIDFLNTVKEVSFEEAWAHRVQGYFSGQKVFYIGLEDLIRNKQAVGRPRDRDDVAALKKKLKGLQGPSKGKRTD